MSDIMISKTNYLINGTGGQWEKLYIPDEATFNSTRNSTEYGSHFVLLLPDIALAQRVLLFQETRGDMLFSAEFHNYTVDEFKYSIRDGSSQWDTARSYFSAYEKSRDKTPLYLYNRVHFLGKDQTSI